MKIEEGNYKVGIEAGITLILMALVPVCIKLTSATPLTIGVFRLLIATILMAIFLRPKSMKSLLKKSIILPLGLIGLLFALHWVTYFLSIKIATASIGILGMSTYGIHLIFLGWIFRNNKPGIFDIVALILALAGAYFIIPEFSVSNHVTLGILLGVFSGLCFAMLPILHQRFAFIPERARISGQFVFGLLSFLFFLPLTDWHLQSVDWWLLLYLAVGGTFIAHSLWVRVTTQISTTISSLIFYLIIPMTMIMSHFWLKEPMELPKIIGALLIVGGNILSLTGRYRVKVKRVIADN